MMTPAAGPLTCKGEPEKKPTTRPPMIPVRMPAETGKPHASAMPMHKGRATRKTTSEAGRSKRSALTRALVRLAGPTSGAALEPRFEVEGLLPPFSADIVCTFHRRHDPSAKVSGFPQRGTNKSAIAPDE